MAEAEAEEAVVVAGVVPAAAAEAQPRRGPPPMSPSRRNNSRAAAAEAAAAAAAEAARLEAVRARRRERFDGGNDDPDENRRQDIRRQLEAAAEAAPPPPRPQPWVVEACNELRSGNFERYDVSNHFDVSNSGYFETPLEVSMFSDAFLLYGKAIHRLDLSFCFRKRPQLLQEFVRRVLPRHLTLEKLFLLNNEIDDVTVETIADQLPSSHLKVLALGGNHIGDRGVAALAKALGSRPATQKDSDHGNTTNPPQQQSPALRDLYLDCNRITDAGCIELATKLIPYNSNLRILWLGSNDKITKKGVSALLRALESSSTTHLKQIYMGDDMIDHNTALDEQCRRNARIRDAFPRVKKLTMPQQKIQVATESRTESTNGQSPRKRPRIASSTTAEKEEDETGTTAAAPASSVAASLLPHALAMISQKPDYLYDVVRSSDLLQHLYSSSRSATPPTAAVASMSIPSPP